MIKLSKNNVDTAKAFIMNRGRPLEKALCRFHFDDGSKEQILVELGKFQRMPMVDLDMLWSPI